MPGNSSGSETVLFDRSASDAPEVAQARAAVEEAVYTTAPSPEVTAYAKKRKQPATVEPETFTDVPVTVGQNHLQAHLIQEFTKSALQAGEQIMHNRHMAVTRAIQQSGPAYVGTKPPAGVRTLEILFGKPLARTLTRGVAKSAKTLSLANPQARYRQFEREHKRREAEIGRRVLGQEDMYFYPQDKATWVWHIEASGDNPPQTFLYHIRPDGVLKQRLAERESPTKVAGQELENFGHYIRAFYGELARSNYDQN